MQQGLSSLLRNNVKILACNNLPSNQLNNVKNYATEVQKSASSAASKNEKEPQSPFQNTNNAVEYALARVDDLLAWGRRSKLI